MPGYGFRSHGCGKDRLMIEADPTARNQRWRIENLLASADERDEAASTAAVRARVVLEPGPCAAGSLDRNLHMFDRDVGCRAN